MVETPSVFDTPLSQLLKSYARVADFKGFEIDEKRDQGVDDLFGVFTKDMVEEGYREQLNKESLTGAGIGYPSENMIVIMDRIAERFFKHFKDLTIEQVSTLLAEKGGFLRDSWYMHEASQRRLLKVSADHDNAIARKELTKPNVQNRIAWTSMVERTAEISAKSFTLKAQPALGIPTQS